MSSSPRALVAALITSLAAVLAVAVPSAHAAIDVDLKTAQPAPLDAGAHPDFTLDVGFPVGANPKDVTISFPPGLVGDPGGPAKCAITTFHNSTCPNSTKVGTATITMLGLLPAPGTIYNLEPNGTEPARLGTSVAGLIKTESSVRVRISDYGLNSFLTDLPPGVTNIKLTLQGIAGNGKPFMVNPTSCKEAPVTVSAVGAGGDTGSATKSFTPTNCDKVPFSPSLEVGPTQVHADEPGASRATLVVPGTDTVGSDGIARRQAHVDRVELLLPEGLVLSPGIANNLQPCTEEEFGEKVDATPKCPANSEIGTVQFSTPVFDEPLSGKVYLGVPKPGQKLRNFVSVEDPRLRVKLIGDVVADPVTGRVLNVFPSSPQVPFTRFLFEYQGNEGDKNAVLTAPAACGDYLVTATMSPHNGGAPQSPTATFNVFECGEPAFTPTLTTTVPDAGAGGDAALTVKIDRPDKQGRLQGVHVSLPAGFAGRLGAVPACSIEDARKLACPEASKVGSVGVTVGTGPKPLTLPARGPVYLTEAYNGGIAGLAIVVPAKAGGLDFGTVLTLASIRVRPGDAGIDVVTDPLPQIVDGIPIVYRSIDLTVDRPGFLRNATSCAPQTMNAAFTGTKGETAGSQSPYQSTGCENRPYAPKMLMQLGGPGETGANKHPGLRAILTQSEAELTSRKVTVTLPSGIGTDLEGLNRACPEVNVLAGTCPPNAKVGEVRVETPLLPYPLTGAVLFQRPAKVGLPQLSIALPQVGIRLVADVVITSDGRIQTVFNGIPDVPLTRFELLLYGGKGAPLITARDLCATPKPEVAGLYESQAGRTSQSPATVEVLGCGKGSGPKAKAGKLTVSAKLLRARSSRPELKLTARATTAIKDLRIRLPKQLRWATASSLKKQLRVSASGRRLARPKMKVSNGRLVVSGFGRKGTRRVDVRLYAGALQRKAAIKRRAKLSFAFDAAPLQGKRLTRSAKVTAR